MNTLFLSKSLVYNLVTNIDRLITKVQITNIFPYKWEVYETRRRFVQDEVPAFQEKEIDADYQCIARMRDATPLHHVDCYKWHHQNGSSGRAHTLCLIVAIL